MSDVYSLIPAGGKSTRMGRPKLALPLGECTVLEHVIRALHRGGIEHIVVVVGPHVPELIPLAQAAGAHVCLLLAETPDMRATLEAGFRWLEERFRPRATDCWLLVPGDHPTLDADVVRQLLRARAEHAACSIVLPTYEGKRGHPTLIDWKHVDSIRARPREEGINRYLRDHRAETLEIPAATDAILADLDTPEEYERLCRNWASGQPQRATL
jgi:molybdenum cofactor cytidylyltransferase